VQQNSACALNNMVDNSVIKTYDSDVLLVMGFGWKWARGFGS